MGEEISKLSLFCSSSLSVPFSPSSLTSLDCCVFPSLKVTELVSSNSVVLLLLVSRSHCSFNSFAQDNEIACNMSEDIDENDDKNSE